MGGSPKVVKNKSNINGVKKLGELFEALYCIT